MCGAAASSRTTQLVPDVEKFEGHIACDGDSKSEIVVPIVVGDRVSTFPAASETLPHQMTGSGHH